MEKKKTLDYLFITWGKPFSSSSGAVNNLIYFITNSLARDGAIVSIPYIFDIYISTSFYIRDATQKNYMQSLN